MKNENNKTTNNTKTITEINRNNEKINKIKKIIEKNTPYNGKAEIIQIKTLAAIRGIFIYFPFFLIPVILCIAL